LVVENLGRIARGKDNEVTLLGGVGRNDPLVAKSLKKERIVVTLRTTCRKNGICENLVEARVLPMSNYGRIFATDGHSLKVTGGGFALGPLY
jgi:hypothetical protein